MKHSVAEVANSLLAEISSDSDLGMLLRSQTFLHSFHNLGKLVNTTNNIRPARLQIDSLLEVSENDPDCDLLNTINEIADPALNWVLQNHADVLNNAILKKVADPKIDSDEMLEALDKCQASHGIKKILLTLSEMARCKYEYYNLKQLLPQYCSQGSIAGFFDGKKPRNPSEIAVKICDHIKCLLQKMLRGMPHIYPTTTLESSLQFSPSDLTWRPELQKTKSIEDERSEQYTETIFTLIRSNNIEQIRTNLASTESIILLNFHLLCEDGNLIQYSQKTNFNMYRELVLFAAQQIIGAEKNQRYDIAERTRLGIPDLIYRLYLIVSTDAEKELISSLTKGKLSYSAIDNQSHNRGIFSFAFSRDPDFEWLKSVASWEVLKLIEVGLETFSNIYKHFHNWSQSLFNKAYSPILIQRCILGSVKPDDLVSNSEDEERKIDLLLSDMILPFLKSGVSFQTLWELSNQNPSKFQLLTTNAIVIEGYRLGFWSITDLSNVTLSELAQLMKKEIIDCIKAGYTFDEVRKTPALLKEQFSELFKAGIRAEAVKHLVNIDPKVIEKIISKKITPSFVEVRMSAI